MRRSRKYLAVGTVLGLLVLGALFGLRSRVAERRSPHVVQGESAYARKDYAASARHAGARLTDDPADPAAIRLMARASARLGRHDLAMPLFLRMDRSQYETEDFYLVGAGLVSRGKIADARAPWEMALRADPGHAETLRGLADLNLRLDRPHEALGLARRLAGADGSEPVGSTLLAQVFDRLDEPADAVAAWRAALARDANLQGASVSARDARKALARDLLRLGRPSEARDELARLRSAETADDSETAWLMGRADLQEGRTNPRKDAASAGEDVGSWTPDPLAYEPSPYVGSAACVRCHASIAQVQRKSPHAGTLAVGRTLTQVPLPAEPLDVEDPVDPQTHHRLERTGDSIKVTTRTLDGPELKAVVKFVAGAGTPAMTLVGRDARGEAYEFRLSHYGASVGWDITTGHARAPKDRDHWLGRPLTADDVRLCLGCHSTRTSSAVGGPGPEAAEGGIGCERCHGPGANHLKAVELGWTDDLAIARPKLARGRALVGLCGRCHSNKLMAFTPEDPKAVRFQATTLTWSECYRASRDALDCVTCHDPHRPVVRGDAGYEAVCLRCHDARPRTVCRVNPKNGCIGCHMPKVRDVVPHFTFADHHIRVHRPSP